MWQLWYPADFRGRSFGSASPFLAPRCAFAAFPGAGVAANAGRGGCTGAGGGSPRGLLAAEAASSPTHTRCALAERQPAGGSFHCVRRRIGSVEPRSAVLRPVAACPLERRLKFHPPPPPLEAAATANLLEITYAPHDFSTCSMHKPGRRCGKMREAGCL